MRSLQTIGFDPMSSSLVWHAELEGSHIVSLRALLYYAMDFTPSELRSSSFERKQELGHKGIHGASGSANKGKE